VEKDGKRISTNNTEEKKGKDGLEENQAIDRRRKEI